ncbi:MAG: Gfo/Idh/MocA family oxidoreductase [Nitrospiria bacterium]
MMNKPLSKVTHSRPKVAVVGGGYWGKNLVRNFSALDTLSAICDQDNKRLNRLRVEYPETRILSFNEILKEASIPAVAISTPAETHYDLVKEALHAGKDVFVEKPLALSVGEGQYLAALARKNERILMVGHLLWYHPAVLKLKSLIDQGALGRIQYIYSNRLNLGKIRREENILWSFAPHDISVILGLLDEVPDQVDTQGGNYLHPKIADVTVSLLSFPSGVKAHIFVSWLHPYKEQKMIVVGDRKMAVFNDLEKEDKLLLYPHSIEWKNHIPVPNKAEAQRVECETTEPLRAECEHFLKSIQTRNTPRTDAEEGIRVLKVLEQSQKGLETQTAQQSEAPLSSSGYDAHPSAFIDEGVEIGDGSKIWHVSHVLNGSRLGKNCRIGQNCVIGPDVTLGDNVKVQNNVSIYQGVTLEDDVFCGPSMVFTNVINPRSEFPRMDQVKSTRVKKGATIGANATILCGITIGSYAFIAAGSVVTHDVDDFALLMGNPARRTNWVCRCGVVLVFNENHHRCIECNRVYQERENLLKAVDHS